MLNRAKKIFAVVCASAAVAAYGQQTNTPVASASTSSSDQIIKDEVRFAEGLIRMRFPDYAKKVMDQLVAKYPDAKPAAAAVRIKAATAQGKFEDAEALVASMPGNTVDAMTMRLALSDSYFQWGKLTKAFQGYDSFFKTYSSGPPKEIKVFYEESAYKYYQMLMVKNDNAGALQALGYVLLAKPDPDIQRTIQADMAELQLKLGTATNGAAREAYFKAAISNCNDVQFKEMDVLFGKTVVILAHIAMARGKPTEARKTINDYMPILKKIDDYIRAEKMPLRDSPMAQCRYLLGTLHEEEGRALYAEAGKETEAAAQLGLALTQLYTVFVNYPSSTWAPAAGQHCDELVKFLETKGKKVQLPTTIDMAPVIAAQFKEAKMMFLDNNFKEASKKYLDVLTLFPSFPGSVTALGELAQCYVQEKDDVYANATIRYLAERFSRDETLKKEAGNALLAVAQTAEDAGQPVRAAQIHALFFDKFPGHERTPNVLFRFGDAKVRTANYADAIPYFQRVVDEYPKARVYTDALNRLAFCQSMTGDHTNAIKSLTAFIAELPPGVDKIAATLRLADSYRLSKQLIPAINEYSRILTYLRDEAPKYSAGADDAAKNQKSKERAMFFKALCYSSLKQPEDKLAEYQMKAIEGYNELLKEAPKSELAPSAISGVGTIYYLMSKPEEAGKAFERLQREFPQSEQASNVLFVQIVSLKDMGQMDKAAQVAERMIGNTKAYKPPQFRQVGMIMMDAEQYPTAEKAFVQARASNDRAVWESATIGLGQALAAQSKYAEAVAPLEELLTKYAKTGYTVPACLVLSRAYAEMAQKEVDPKRKADLFGKAIKSMNTVRDFTRDPAVLANADIELAAIQLLMGKKSEALASYQRVVMFSKDRTAVEKAFEFSVPLLMEAGKLAEALENCENYLNGYPKGRLVAQARKWRDELVVKGVRRSDTGLLDKSPAPAPAATNTASAAK